jgi:hypothetical protein
MATRTTVGAGGPTRQQTLAEIAYLTRALKAPTLRDSVERLAERARAESWTHEQFLAACLQREVSARDSHGGEGRIRAARFPARNALEEFDYEHQRATTGHQRADHDAPLSARHAVPLRIGRGCPGHHERCGPRASGHTAVAMTRRRTRNTDVLRCRYVGCILSRSAVQPLVSFLG